MIRALWQLAVASVNLLAAKTRGLAHPCPPHEYDERWEFCLKCGQYRTHGTSS